MTGYVSDFNNCIKLPCTYVCQAWQSEHDRLMTLLSTKPQSPHIPLCVLCVADGSFHQLSIIIEGLQLDSLLTAGVVSDYRVYTLSDNVTDHISLSNVSHVGFLLLTVTVLSVVC